MDYPIYHNGKHDRWVDNVIKGRIAETIVEQLFISLGFKVFRFGMENTVPGIIPMLDEVNEHDKVSKMIRRMPDFVVIRDGKVHFIEVKYRANENYNFEDLSKKGEYHYKEALFVVLSKRHIKCLSYRELENKKEITEKCQNYLGKRPEFENDQEEIIRYCRYAVKFFESV